MGARVRSGIMEMVFLGGLICSKPCCFDMGIVLLSLSDVQCEQSDDSLHSLRSESRLPRATTCVGKIQVKENVDCDMTDHSYP